MAVIYDELGNSIGKLDTIGGETLIDTRVISQNISALNGEVFFDCAGTDSTSVDIRGTFVGTFVVEATINGTNYFSIPFFVPTTEFWVTTITAAGSWICHLPSGCKRVRVRSTAFTSGTAIVYLRGSSSGNITYAKPIPTVLSVTATAAASATVTATLAAAGVGLFHYITRIRISKYVSATLTAGAAPSIVTSTNLASTPSFDFKTLGALGDSEVMDIDFTGNPLKSSNANTATTFVAPVLTGAIWKIQVFYYAGA